MPPQWLLQLLSVFVFSETVKRVSRSPTTLWKFPSLYQDPAAHTQLMKERRSTSTTTISRCRPTATRTWPRVNSLVPWSEAVLLLSLLCRHRQALLLRNDAFFIHSLTVYYSSFAMSLQFFVRFYGSCPVASHYIIVSMFIFTNSVS